VFFISLALARSYDNLPYQSLELIDNNSTLTGLDRLKERSSVMNQKIMRVKTLNKILREYPFLYAIKKIWSSDKDTIKIRYANKVIQQDTLFFPATFRDCFPYSSQPRNHVEIFVYCQNHEKQEIFLLGSTDDSKSVTNADIETNIAALVLTHLAEKGFQPTDVDTIAFRYQWYDGGIYKPDFMSDEIQVFKSPIDMSYEEFLGWMSKGGIIPSRHWSDVHVPSHQL